MPPATSLATSVAPLAPPPPSLTFQNNQMQVVFPNNPALAALVDNIELAETIEEQLALIEAAIAEVDNNIVEYAALLELPVGALREKLEEMSQEVDDIRWQMNVMWMQLRTLLFSGFFCCTTMLGIVSYHLYKSLTLTEVPQSIFEGLTQFQTLKVVVKLLGPPVGFLAASSYLYAVPARRYKAVPSNRDRQKGFIRALKLVNWVSLANITWNFGMLFYRPIRATFLSGLQIGLATGTLRMAINAAAVNVSVNLDIGLQ